MEIVGILLVSIVPKGLCKSSTNVTKELYSPRKEVTTNRKEGWKLPLLRPLHARAASEDSF